MGEEKSRDIAGITVRYSDGSTKEIQSGCCVDLEKGSDDLSVEMLNVKPFGLVRLGYGLVATVQRLGMREELTQYANGVTEMESISPLDYTVIAALKEALEKRAQGQEVKKGAGLCRKNTDESI